MSAFIRAMGKVAITVYRLSGGKIGGQIGAKKRLLILTTTGRKTKLSRSVLVGYKKDGEDYVITSYNLGRPRKPGWWFNLKSDPQAIIQVGRELVRVTAEQADPEQKEHYLTQVAPKYRWYVDMMVLHPRG